MSHIRGVSAFSGTEVEWAREHHFRVSELARFRALNAQIREMDIRLRSSEILAPPRRLVMSPEDEYEAPPAFEEVVVSDPMDTLDLALEFIPAPSAEFNNLLAAITSDPTLDPYPPAAPSLDPN